MVSEFHVFNGILASVALLGAVELQSKLSHSEEGPCAFLPHTAAIFDKDCPLQLPGTILQCFHTLRSPCDKVFVTPNFKKMRNVCHRCYDLIYENNLKIQPRKQFQKRRSTLQQCCVRCLDCTMTSFLNPLSSIDNSLVLVNSSALPFGRRS